MGLDRAGEEGGEEIMSIELLYLASSIIIQFDKLGNLPVDMVSAFWD